MNLYENKSYHRSNIVTAELKKYRKEIVDSCKRCKGEGYILIKKKFDKNTIENIDDLLRKCSCEKKYEWRKKLILSGIQKEFWKVESWRIRSNKNLWKKYILPYSRNLKLFFQKGIGFFLYGENGLGKTTSLMYVLIKAIRKGYNVQYILVKELFDIMRKLSIAKDKNEIDMLNELLDEYRIVDFLAIDEIDKITITPFVKNEFDTFLRYRISKRLPVLISTNLKENQLTECYGKSFHDLVRGNMKVLLYEGTSFRYEKKEQMNEIFETISKLKRRNK